MQQYQILLKIITQNKINGEINGTTDDSGVTEKRIIKYEMRGKEKEGV